jgi:hypothetical protein
VDLQREDPAQLELELAKAGTTPEYLIRDAQDEPALHTAMSLLATDDAKLRLALEYFGDDGHPQPTRRTPPNTGAFGDHALYGSLTPEWGLLPRLKDGQPKPRKPRQRPPGQISRAAVQALMLELERRKAKPRDRELTQRRIAARVGLNQARVQEAEELRGLGWDLLRTHPDFSIEDGFVRWPTPTRAAQILARERAEK